MAPLVAPFMAVSEMPAMIAGMWGRASIFILTGMVAGLVLAVDDGVRCADPLPPAQFGATKKTERKPDWHRDANKPCGKPRPILM